MRQLLRKKKLTELYIKRFHILIVLAGMALIAACGPANFPELNERINFSDFGFSIDYPEGWKTVNEGSVTRILELETDFSRRNNRPLISDGIIIALDHRSIDFLIGLGLRGDPPTLNDLFALNIGELSGMTNPNITDEIIFGVPALRSEYYEHQWDISYAGFIEDEAFFFLLSAPNEKMLNDFKPVWEQMLESIAPTSQ